MMAKKLLFLGIILIFVSFAYAQEEQLTITTYYPSPYGSYNELHTSQMAIGLNYQKTTPPANSLIVEGDVGIGTTGPQADLEVNNTLRMTPTDVPNHAVVGALYYDNSEAIYKYNDGTGWKPFGGVQIAQAHRRRINTSPPQVFVLQGPPECTSNWSNCFTALTNVSPDPTSQYSGTKLDGMKCNDANGWRVTGCWLVFNGGDNDIYPYVNGCVSNDGNSADLSIICIK
jgi:hypothetical protein